MIVWVCAAVVATALILNWVRCVEWYYRDMQRERHKREMVRLSIPYWYFKETRYYTKPKEEDSGAPDPSTMEQAWKEMDK